MDKPSRICANSVLSRLCWNWAAFAIVLVVAGCAHTVAREGRTDYLGVRASDHIEEAGGPPDSPAPPDPAPSGALRLKAELSHTFYSRFFPSRLFLKVDLSTVSEALPVRPPLNLSLVIDTSGSMAEDQKFPHAMEAAELVVENVSDQDIVSIISFSNTAIVLSPAGRAVSKEFLHHRLREIAPGGWTNLSAGLLEAFSQIESQEEEGQLRHVIVLTDGNANRGVTSASKLSAMVSAARGRGISLSTLGCGVDFDEEILSALAEAGGGRYTYIHSGELIPTALAAELDGLLEVVAQNVQLTVRAMPDTLITKVYGRPLDEPVTEYAFRLGDVRAREQGFFLLELAPQRYAEGASAGAEAALIWDDTSTGARARTRIQQYAEFSAGEVAVARSENAGVNYYAHALDSLERAEEAILNQDIERFHQLADAFETLAAETRDYALKTRDQQLLNQVYMLRHLNAELAVVYERGVADGQQDARGRLEKEVDYRRYLLEHYRPEAPPETANSTPEAHDAGIQTPP